MSSSVRRRGFTLIEVLVVCATIMVVLAILAPAIQHGRNKARTTQCRNNLKQIGLAMHNYHDTYNSFAPGYVVGTKIAKDEAREMAWNLGWGWQASILPYLDQAPLFNTLNFNLGLPTEVGKVTTTKVSMLRCPEDKGSPLVSHVKVLGPLPGDHVTTVVEKGFARSNYVGNAGWDNDWHLGMTAKANPNAAADAMASNWSKQEVGNDFRDGIAIYAGGLKMTGKAPCPNARDGHGIFGENSHRKIAQMVDGTSFTLLAGERATPTKSGAETDVGNVIWAGVPDRSTRAGQALSLASAYLPINHELTAESVPNTTGYSSRHGGGVNLLFGDGLAKTVSEKMDLALLRRLSIIDDGTTGAVDIPNAP